MGTPLRLTEVFESLPAAWPATDLRGEIRAQVEASGTKIVVLDDDPTGTQTVHDVPVLTSWDTSVLANELRSGQSLFYILTNSRALSQNDAVALARTLGINLSRAIRQTGCRLSVISRSDSTLRGHYPAETDALAEALDLTPDGVLIVPYFQEGGRFTINDVHYVREGQCLVPAAETEFARDPVFGYRQSNLRQWVEEKTGGRWRAEQVLSLPLPVIRQGGPEQIAALLVQATNGQPVVVNAACDRDLEVVVKGLLQAEAAGKQFLCRTAASFVKVRGGISDQGLLAPAELLTGQSRCAGGLVVVGSHVPRSTRQLQALLSLEGWHGIEVDVASLLTPATRRVHLNDVGRQLAAALASGRHVALFTSRTLVTGQSKAESLDIGQSVSLALVELVERLHEQPRFLIAKGGITSSDIAARALGVRRAIVMGQVAPGIPVWRLGSESRFPGLAYVIFPGNVGDDNTLAQVAAKLAAVG
ncbi:MAG: four-carbon acid sugar kinase family protein [Anaerolineae bacterium]